MDFVLPFLPHGALAASVITTVWVGVWVIVFFNLRLGWVLSGLVVPGYLVPLLLINPLSAVVILLEAVATYVLVWLFSEKLSKLGGWNNLFGRDRFFALLIVSVLVRLLSEIYIFPPLGRYLTENLGISFDYQNLLHSYGLIIVALIANQFWKPGLFRGTIPLTVTVAVTYLLVRYGLVPFTNFNLGNLGYMYEDLAASMLASPKAYIILIATALAASRINLRYGWEFSGILIPALLALQWYKPTKLAASFAEAFVILGVAKLLLNLPMFKNATVEGGRKILLFFNISFVYKILLGYLILWLFPQLKITDYYAFGYLLATLLAIKMYDRDILGQVTRATLQTSLVSVLVASMIGFSLQLLPNVFASNLQKEISKFAGKQEVFQRAESDLSEVVQKDKVTLYKNREQDLSKTPSPRENEIFKYSLEKLKDYRKTGNKTALYQADSLLSEIEYQVDLIGSQYLYIRALESKENRGIFVLNMDTQSSLMVQIPSALNTWGILDAGTRLFRSFNARALAITARERDGTSPLRASITNPNSFFYAFHRAFDNLDTLQVRGYTRKKVRQLTGERIQTGEALPDIPSRLYVKSSIPRGIDLASLKSFLNKFKVLWGEPPYANLLREQQSSGFAELLLNRKDRRDLFFKPVFQAAKQEVQGRQTIVGYIQDWLLQGKEWLAEKGSNEYQPPSVQEMLYMDNEVIAPLVNVSEKEYKNKGGWTEKGRKELRAIRSAASVLDYQILTYRSLVSGHEYLILLERKDHKDRRYWGTYVLLLGTSQNFMLQIPRPLYEIRTFEFGVHLFNRLDARALMIGGTHPNANTDLSSDLILAANKQNMFNLFEQVLLRESEFDPMFVAQCRGFGPRPETAFPESDVLMSFHSGIKTQNQIGPLGEELHATLRNEGFSPGFVDGSRSTMGYEVGGLPQAEYLEQTVNKRFALLWLSPLARKSYRQQSNNTIQNQQFRALNIPTRQLDVIDFILEHNRQTRAEVPARFKQGVRGYVKNQDILQLSGLRNMLQAGSCKRLIDINTKQSYLLLQDSGNKPLVLANLSPKKDVTRRVARQELTREFARSFVKSGEAFLYWGRSE